MAAGWVGRRHASRKQIAAHEGNRRIPERRAVLDASIRPTADDAYFGSSPGVQVAGMRNSALFERSPEPMIPQSGPQSPFAKAHGRSNLPACPKRFRPCSPARRQRLVNIRPRDRAPSIPDLARLASSFRPVGERLARSIPCSRSPSLRRRADMDAPARHGVSRGRPHRRSGFGDEARRRSATGIGPLRESRTAVSTARTRRAIASTRNGRRAGRPNATSAPGPKRRGARAA